MLVSNHHLIICTELHIYTRRKSESNNTIKCISYYSPHLLRLLASWERLSHVPVIFLLCASFIVWIHYMLYSSSGFCFFRVSPSSLHVCGSLGFMFLKILHFFHWVRLEGCEIVDRVAGGCSWRFLESKEGWGVGCPILDVLCRSVLWQCTVVCAIKPHILLVSPLSHLRARLPLRTAPQFILKWDYPLLELALGFPSDRGLPLCSWRQGYLP